MATETYWATIAQVAPVVALAMLLEIRHITTAWRPQAFPVAPFGAVGWAVIAALMTFWTGVLSCLVFTEILTLSVLRGMAAPGWFPVFAESAINCGLGVAVLAPVALLAHRLVTDKGDGST